jgi:predicted metal-dependent hydrolase
MLTTQQEAWLEAGMVNFNTGRFWHAHEDWEDLWKSLKGFRLQRCCSTTSVAKDAV